jgi:hydroxypyruvate isomerase
VIKGFSAHLNSLYGHLDEADRCAAAAADGFRCVEMWAPPEPDAARRLGERIQQLGVSVASINTHQGPEPDDFGLVGEPSRVDWWREHFRSLLEFARAVNAEGINVLVGGRRQGVARKAQRRCLLDNLEWALGQLEAEDPVLLLEPLNAADRRSPLLQNAAGVLSVMSELGSPPRLRLLFDAYHLFQEEDDLIEALHLAAGTIGHVQIADYPGRAEPGTGEIPVAEFLTELDRTGYSGWVGLEYFPSGRDGSPFAWLRDYPAFHDRSLPEVAF